MMAALLPLCCAAARFTAGRHAPLLGRRAFARRAAPAAAASAAPAADASSSAPRCWTCVKGCGACCYLAPEERPGLDEWLPPDDLKLYESMVGSDGWCVHYDKASRGCTVYTDRPWFCRVSSDHFLKMFGVERDELDEFAIDCCREHIDGMFGSGSDERARFEAATLAEGAEAAARMSGADGGPPLEQ